MPAGTRILGQGCDTLRGAFEHIARHRAHAVDRALTDPVREHIYQAREVRCRCIERADLHCAERLGAGLDLVAEEGASTASGRAAALPGDPHRLDPVVDPAAEQIQPAGPEAPSSKSVQSYTTSLPV